MNLEQGVHQHRGLAEKREMNPLININATIVLAVLCYLATERDWTLDWALWVLFTVVVPYGLSTSVRMEVGE